MIQGEPGTQTVTGAVCISPSCSLAFVEPMAKSTGPLGLQFNVLGNKHDNTKAAGLLQCKLINAKKKEEEEEEKWEQENTNLTPKSEDFPIFFYFTTETEIGQHVSSQLKSNGMT